MISIDPSQGDTAATVLIAAINMANALVSQRISAPIQYNWNGTEVTIQKEVFISSRTVQVRNFSEGMDALRKGSQSAYFSTNGVEVFMKRG